MKIVKINLLCIILKPNDCIINNIIKRVLIFLVLLEKDFNCDFPCYTGKIAPKHITLFYIA